MTVELLPSVEINPTLPATATIIWLHGLGADGHDFADIVPQLRLSDSLSVRFIFPHAPIRPVTLNGGMHMRAWFDLAPALQGFQVDEQHIEESEQAIDRLIQHQESLGIQSSRIILAGFSQGGSIALFSGLRYPRPLGGILALSTFLPITNNISETFTTVNQQIPIMMAHGDQDHMIPLTWAQQTQQALKKLDYAIDFHTYPMAHSVCTEEIIDITAWLIKTLEK